MNYFLSLAFSKNKTILMTLFMIFVIGIFAFKSISKEAEPDVQIPVIYVAVSHEAISPKDAERLILRPLERELQSLEGVKEMRASAKEGYASIVIEFDANYNLDKALSEVRERVDTAKGELPTDSREPKVKEINISLFPVLTISLSGLVPERTLVTLAKDLKDKIEVIPGILEAKIIGKRDEVIEISVDKNILESYNLSTSELYNNFAINNKLIAAGTIDNENGKFSVKIPGMIDNIDDILNFPIKSHHGQVIKFKDIADIKRLFRDRHSYSRVNGNPAILIEVSKRVGSNIIETIAKVREIVDNHSQDWPATIKINYQQDKSDKIKDMLSDLQNNILSAIILVMIIMIAAMGLRPALLVGVAIC